MTTATPTFPQKLELFARDIKLSHTVFALPFALLSTALAWQQIRGPILGKLLLILLCMISARTVAMAANRLFDAHLDALNPRTASRAIPAGRLSPTFFIFALTLCTLAFLAATATFLHYHNPWPLIFSLPVLLFLTAYPFLKRFTRLCHYYLGAALALAPICAWVAITGSLNPTPFLIAAAVLLWTAGFDIIYACQDYHSDLQTGVTSLPARLGIPKALWIARLTHTASATFLVLLGLYSPSLGLLYFLGVFAAIALLIIEHSLVKPTDLSKVNLAFFTLNGLISLLLGTLGILDTLL
ncbi:MAG: 4-hydroxybenzoate octaprenyltransferase [Bacillota bacterium]